MATKERVLILGAAGRDFHNFNTFFRNNPAYEVVGFTAFQIPKIEGRTYPASLAGALYPHGLHIWPESEMEEIIKKHKVTRCILAYSDLSYDHVMDRCSRVLACGADFGIMGFNQTMLKSTKPVIAVTAVRTGCGKSQTSRYIVEVLKKHGKKAVVVRHPMPYGDLAKQAVQRFETYADLDAHRVTIEEREEYEQHIDNGTVVFAGVDYEAILRKAEAEADVVLWDGGNNDTPFYTPDLWVCVGDPHRVGHELNFFPGNTNFRCAHVICINKANTAPPSAVDTIKKTAARLNPHATIIVTNSEVTVNDPSVIKGKRCLAIDDGPTLTHGGMKFGAGQVAAEKYGAAQLIDPRPFAKGSIRDVYAQYTHMGNLLPAMGYWDEQIKDLSDTINACDCEAVIVATPMDLSRLITIKKPFAVAKYSVCDREAPYLREQVEKTLKNFSH